MADDMKTENKEIPSKDNKEVISLLKKMQQQLDSLEEKIESLIQKSKSKSFEDRRPSRPREEFRTSRPPRPREGFNSKFGRPRENEESDRPSRPRERTYEPRREEGSSEGKFYHGRPSSKSKSGGKKSLGKKKSFFKKTR